MDIDEFIWRMCVSHGRLNQVTLPFEHPMPRCDDAIDNFGDSAGRSCFISLDNKTGYHQIAVRFLDQKNSRGLLPITPSGAGPSCLSDLGMHPPFLCLYDANLQG